ncbi:octopamine receptor-like [Asterias rubens]|uniref:octopamine receptor-like n=1 Tax=Asterias rubens TaxID=7604 RepID=UPI001454F3D7|nr:octopamine receptor-like [Asterias rubens]
MPKHVSLVVLSCFVLGFVALAAVIGNLLVIIAIVRSPTLHTIASVFVFNLALADEAVASLVMTLDVVYRFQGTWSWGHAVCQVWMSTDVLSCSASILTLCSIAVDRYIAIAHPFLYQGSMTKTKAVLVTSLVWAVAFILSVLPMAFRWHEPVGFEQQSDQCILTFNPAFSIISSIVSFYVPFVIMVITYGLIYRVASRQSAKIKMNAVHARVIRITRCTSLSVRVQEPVKYHQKARDNKAAVTLGIIMGCFVICWLPFFIGNIINPLCNNCIDIAYTKAFTWLGYSNSALNPFLYVMFNREIRGAFRQLYTPCLNSR